MDGGRDATRSPPAQEPPAPGAEAILGHPPSRSRGMVYEHAQVTVSRGHPHPSWLAEIPHPKIENRVLGGLVMTWGNKPHQKSLQDALGRKGGVLTRDSGCERRAWLQGAKAVALRDGVSPVNRRSINHSSHTATTHCLWFVKSLGVIPLSTVTTLPHRFIDL